MATSEAERLLRIARRDLHMARRLLDPDVEEASWGWALQQAFKKTLKAWLHHLGVTPPHSHDIARLLVLLEQAGVDVSQLQPLRAFTTFAVQGRYDDDPEELGRDPCPRCRAAPAAPALHCLPPAGGGAHSRAWPYRPCHQQPPAAARQRAGGLPV